LAIGLKADRFEAEIRDERVIQYGVTVGRSDGVVASGIDGKVCWQESGGEGAGFRRDLREVTLKGRGGDTAVEVWSLVTVIACGHRESSLWAGGAGRLVAAGSEEATPAGKVFKSNCPLGSRLQIESEEERTGERVKVLRTG
jgi:hypothetical protein